MHRQKTLEYSCGQRHELAEERILLVVSTTTSYTPIHLLFLSTHQCYPYLSLLMAILNLKALSPSH